MAKRKTNRKTRHLLSRTTHPNAAGIDIGAEELVAAVPLDRDEDPVRTFSTFTGDLHELRDWLLECNVDTVAMESTGNYWIATYQILEEAGIKVCLVNARHVKAVPGRKTDVCDAQWLQHLHAAGLLSGSFRPEKEIVPLRYLMRHRRELIENASRELLHMQKVLTEMNIKLHHVFSDIDGLSSLRIIDAILEGERDAEVLWKLRDKRCRAPKEVFVAAIEGDWRDEYLFVLGLCLGRWRTTQADIAACDEQLRGLVTSVEGVTDEPCPPASSQRKRRNKNDPAFSVREEAWRFYGVDLSSVDGVASGTLAVLMSELGTGPKILQNFRSGGAFASWLGLCPDNRISGGKILKSKTRHVANKVAQALRMCAQVLGHTKSELGNYCRRMKARLGKAEGITAVAHRLARILFAMIQTRQPYDESKAFQPSPKATKRRLIALKNQAAKLGYELVPQQALA